LVNSEGSQADSNSIGYDWIHNYWCDLLSEKATNGQPNPARPFSITRMAVLCLSLAVFFAKFAEAFSKKKSGKSLCFLF